MFLPFPVQCGGFVPHIRYVLYLAMCRIVADTADSQERLSLTYFGICYSYMANVTFTVLHCIVNTFEICNTRLFHISFDILVHSQPILTVT